MSSALILSVCLDSSLLETRKLVLESAGYLAVSVTSVEEAVSRFLAADFDLVLLGHSIPTRDRERMTHLIRASRPTTPVVFIANSSAQRDYFADATLENDPRKLITGIEEILAKEARTPPSRNDSHLRLQQSGEAYSVLIPRQKSNEP
jgi:CheY-like chemotaxis protein